MVSQERKRRKIEIMAPPNEFLPMPEEQKQEDRGDAIMEPTFVNNGFYPPKMPTRHRKNKAE